MAIFEWRGPSSVSEALPSLEARSIEVNAIGGRSFKGRFIIEDKVSRSTPSFRYEATYMGNGHWTMTSEPSSGPHTEFPFSSNRTVSNALQYFLSCKLNGFLDAHPEIRKGSKPSVPAPPPPNPKPPP